MRWLRDLALLALALFCLSGLLLFPSECLAAAREGLALCFETVLPSLFPFFVLSSLLISGGVGRTLGQLLEPFMRPLFGVSGAGASALALGLLGGYPVGARTVGELYERGEISRAEGEQLLAFCNNSGPAFFLGVCGAGVFHSTRAGLYLYLVHVCAALLTGLLLRRELPAAPRKRQRQAAAPFRLSTAFPAAVQGSFAAVWNVCGFVVLFMVLLRLVTLLPMVGALAPLPRAVLFGIVEMTNGVTALGAQRADFVACAALMGWGGLSVQAQTLAVLAPSGLSARRELLGKAVQALISIPLATLASGMVF